MRTLLAILPVFSQLMVPSLASAQERAPWTATVSMTRKVLAVGECSAVSLVLKSANGESPRGPNGQLVSMADFDLSAGGKLRALCGGKVWWRELLCGVRMSQGAGGNGGDGDCDVSGEVHRSEGARARRFVHDFDDGSDRSGSEQR